MENNKISAETLLIDITDDMYCGSLPDEIIQSFVCILCQGIVINPVKCETCELMVCKRCLPNKNFECYNKCGSKSSYTDKHNKQISTIYNQLKFECQNEQCEELIPIN